MQSDASSLPVTPTYFPATQPMQASVDVTPYMPLTHAVHDDAPAFARVSVTDPAPQSSQSDASSLPVTSTYFPATQSMQSTSAPLPTTSTNLPAGHPIQSLVALCPGNGPTNLPSAQGWQLSLAADANSPAGHLPTNCAVAGVKLIIMIVTASVHIAQRRGD